MYVWNCFSVIACCEHLLDTVLEQLHATVSWLTELGQHDRRYHRRYFYDDFSLAMLVKGVCLRHKRNVDEALQCFQFVISQ